VIAFLVLPAVIAVIALLLHHRHWRHGAAGQHVLVTLPAALLFLILPVPFLLFRTMRGFQRLAADGVNSPGRAADLVLDINRALWLGSLGVLLIMSVAAVLQWRASTGDDGQRSEGPRTWAEWILAACALLVVPALLLTYFVGDVPRSVIRAMEITSGTRVAPSDLSALSANIARLIIGGLAAGTLLAILGVVVAAAAVLSARAIPQPRRPARFAWALLAIVLVAAAWQAVRLPFERQWIERVSAAAAARTRTPHGP
jgi:hypothetical protein